MPKNQDIRELINALEAKGELNKNNKLKYEKYASSIVWIFIIFPVIAYILPDVFPFRDIILVVYLIGSIYYWEIIFLKPIKTKYLLYTSGKKINGTIRNINKSSKLENIEYIFSPNDRAIFGKEKLPSGLFKTNEEVVILYNQKFPKELHCLYHPSLVDHYNLRQSYDATQEKKARPSFLKSTKKITKILSFLVIFFIYGVFTGSLVIYPDSTKLIAKKYIITIFSSSEKAKSSVNKDLELSVAIRNLHAYNYRGTSVATMISRHRRGIELTVKYGADGANAVADAIFANKPQKFSVRYASRGYYTVNIKAARKTMERLVTKMSIESIKVLENRLLNSPSNISEESESVKESILEAIKIQKLERKN